MCVWRRAFDHPECWSKGVRDVKKPRLSGVQPQDGQQQLEGVTHATLQCVGHALRREVRLPEVVQALHAFFIKCIHTTSVPLPPNASGGNKGNDGRVAPKVQCAPVGAEKNLFSIKEAATHLFDQRSDVLVQLRNTLVEVVCQAIPSHGALQNSRCLSATRGFRVRMHVEDVQQASNRSAACWDSSGVRSQAPKLRMLLHLEEGLEGGLQGGRSWRYP
mmetsp:Transcript_3798/g.10574  ORF Transcript_3798/g.10574 Transcript_3798/m.10574 type:complete len:218 (-) Transcript_3798:179-832(-)